MNDLKSVSNKPVDRDEELREDILATKRQTGGDPSLLLDLLCELMERESWKKRGDDGWTFLRYVETPFDEGGLGWSRDEVDNIIDFRHRYEKEGPRQDPEKVKEMEQLRRTVKDLLNPEVEGHGGDRKSEDADQVDNINSNDGGDSESYVVRRLKRDHPQLAEKVLDGDMSANQAAIKAGFRDKKASIPIHKGGEPQIERAAKSLANHFDGHLDALINQLQCHA